MNSGRIGLYADYLACVSEDPRSKYMDLSEIWQRYPIHAGSRRLSLSLAPAGPATKVFETFCFHASEMHLPYRRDAQSTIRHKHSL